MQPTTTFAALALTTALAGAAQTAVAAEIQITRFFGDCQSDYADVTDPAQATGECGIITALTNQFNAENPDGHTVTTQVVDWAAYYDLLTATYATGNIPDLAMMHSSILPNFSSRNLLTPLGPLLADAGIDTADLLPIALENASADGEAYALPFDLHSLLFHINADLMQQAGFVNEDGTTRLPTTSEEFIEMGTAFEEATGQNFIAVGSQPSEGLMVRFFQSLLWQQGVDALSQDGTTASLNGPEGLQAATFIKRIYDDGLADPSLDDAGAEQAFLNGEAGILLNGTWAVDSYDSQAQSGSIPLRTYEVASLPTLYGTEAVWADSHMWVIPVDEARSPEELDAALDFLAFLHANDLQWSRTGHLPVRRSVIESADYAALPHRQSYSNVPAIAQVVPRAQNQRGIQNILTTELNAMWLSGTEPQAALAAAQTGVDRILRRSPG